MVDLSYLSVNNHLKPKGNRTTLVRVRSPVLEILDPLKFVLLLNHSLIISVTVTNPPGGDENENPFPATGPIHSLGKH